MSKRGARELPILVKVSVALTLFNSWVLFEETVVDRLGWWKYMPCYQVGKFCEWDVGAILVISLVVGMSFSTHHVADRLRRVCSSLGCRPCREA